MRTETLFYRNQCRWQGRDDGCQLAHKWCIWKGLSYGSYLRVWHYKQLTEEPVSWYKPMERAVSIFQHSGSPTRFIWIKAGLHFNWGSTETAIRRLKTLLWSFYITFVNMNKILLQNGHLQPHISCMWKQKQYLPWFYKKFMWFQMSSSTGELGERKRGCGFTFLLEYSYFSLP